MTGRVKVAILGGSALATPSIFEVIGKRGAAQPYDFVLYGRDQERLELVKKVSDSIVDSYPGLDLKVSVTNQVEQALEGAHFCVNQIRAGGLEGRAFDETFPRQFGIPGEETVGPGGFNNSIRGIPLILDICRVTERVAPEAVLLNLSNPSSIVQYAIRRYTSLSVVGTCDSPVSLMEMIAQLLGYSSKELQFDIAGMHHFSWITRVKQGDEELIPEVLSRIEELPKLGTDPELIRALGVIPSVYLKYYFHPDRVLAETEGRTIRAHQLMALSDQILDAYRRWEPGSPPTMLAKRGAVWYEKIVVPALLALAEKHNTELVLSTDNQNHLPWLPPQAIVELPVSIRDGKLEAARASKLPQNIQVMVAQNCAYEMLAAEAIVEKDRSKAIQALMSNLFVRSFNQARGILNLIWPDESRDVFPILTPQEKGQAKVEFKVPTLYYGDDLIEKFDPPEETFALITMEELWDSVKNRFTRLPSEVLFVRELDWYRLEAMERTLSQVESILGLGGGVAQDAAKYIGWRRHIPVDEFASITSVDASVTKSIAARAGGHVTYIGYIVPRNVYIDYKLIQSAPARLNRSGVGDILCAHTALWDWKFSHEKTGESYDPAAVEAMKNWLERISTEAGQIRSVTKTGIRTIMLAFEEISIICRRFGSSRPQEGSDHTFAYNAEFQTGKNFLHGELVALGAWVLANLQDNHPDFLARSYERTGILWQPKDIGLTRDELSRTLSTLNWYQNNFGRRYSVLNDRKIDQAFNNHILTKLQFE